MSLIFFLMLEECPYYLLIILCLIVYDEHVSCSISLLILYVNSK